MTRRKLTITLLFLALTAGASAQSGMSILRKNIEQITRNKKATVGVGICGLAHNDTLSLNGDSHLPMQSVFKFHIALCVLHLIDQGRFSLEQKIYIKKSDLLPNTWSPLRDQYPNGNLYLSLNNILRFTVSQSDNNGCDILLKLVGGPLVVNNFIHQTGISDVSIKASEEEMHKDWNVQFTNWTTPIASSQLLKLFYDRKILSPKTHDYLWNIMTETSTGKDNIKAQLPQGTPVAHKTGSSGANKQGITAATNDIGIVTLPNGKHFAISVFVSNSKEDAATNAHIIAAIAKATWDYFKNNNNEQH